MDAFISCEERDEESNGSDEMNKIKFSYVWDKLNDPEFTTIRSWTKEKSIAPISPRSGSKLTNVVFGRTWRLLGVSQALITDQ